MAKYKTTRVFPLILLLVVTAVVIAALISLARIIFFPSDSKQATSVNKSDSSIVSLLKTDADMSVRMTARGPIVADEDFRSSQIVISPNSRNISVYSGYLDKKIDEKSYSNNIPAYTEFVYALNKAKLLDGSADDNDVRGVCAPGYVYVTDVLKDNKVIDSRWTSTCSGSKGSLVAYLPQIKSLFDNQIPDLKSIIKRNSL